MPQAGLPRIKVGDCTGTKLLCPKNTGNVLSFRGRTYATYAYLEKKCHEGKRVFKALDPQFHIENVRHGHMPHRQQETQSHQPALLQTARRWNIFAYFSSADLCAAKSQ